MSIAKEFIKDLTEQIIHGKAYCKSYSEYKTNVESALRIAYNKGIEDGRRFEREISVEVGCDGNWEWRLP